MSTFNFITKKIINNLYLILIITFSFLINWYYSRYGAFPMDTFLHYDSAFRILNGEYPIKDYWATTGIAVDFIQALFFKIFGVNWTAYVIHSSLFNLVISIFTFYILIKFNLKKIYAFLYTISFSLLAYPISGTPFVDLHSSFFCMIAIYFSFLAIKKPETYFNWALVVSFYVLAFFSKQVPTAYLLIFNILIIFPYLIINKKFKPLIVIFLFFLTIILLCLLLIIKLNISLNLFYIQYFDFPRSIGFRRLNFFNTSIESFITHYKFILIPIIILSCLKLKKIINNKISFFSREFVIFLIFLSLCVSLIMHQMLTKNQIFIYFLIPLSLGMLHCELEKTNLKFKPLFVYLMIFLLSFSTIKYHLRFNESRKFHELDNVNFSKFEKAITLDASLKGLFWITPFYEGSPRQEIQMLKKIKKEIEKKKNEIMLITHYLFLDSIISKDLNAPSRTNTIDGVSVPMVNSKYFSFYQKFLKQKIIQKKIKEVYFIKSENLSKKIFTDFFEKKCYLENEDENLIIFKINPVCLN